MLQVAIRDGKLRIEREGKIKKFRRRVLEKTFAAATCGGRPVLYVTERAVLQLRGNEGRLELLEIAPGVDLQRDVLQQMEFTPLMHEVKRMDHRCFEA